MVGSRRSVVNHIDWRFARDAENLARIARPWRDASGSDARVDPRHRERARRAAIDRSAGVPSGLGARAHPLARCRSAMM
jgi:hypothetical protein